MCREAHLVADDQHGHAFARELPHHREHLADELGIEHRGRLVEQHDAGAHRERAGDRHALLLAAGELLRVVARVGLEPDPAQHLEAGFFSFLPAHAFDHAQRLRDVAKRRHVPPQVEVLEHHAGRAAHFVDLALARQDASAVHLEERDAARLGRSPRRPWPAVRAASPNPSRRGMLRPSTGATPGLALPSRLPISQRACSAARVLQLPAREVRYSITAKRLPSLLLLPHLAPLPPSKRIRRLCTGWPCHWS